MKKRNNKYWIDRTAALEQSIQDEATPTVNNIIRAYERAIDNINGDMKKVFREFSRASGISEDKAAEIISSAESDELYADLVKLLDETEDEKLRADIITKINAQAYGARISRLEAIKQRVYTHLKRAQNAEISEHTALHKETFQRSYYSNIYNTAKGFDIGINFSVLPIKAIEKVLSEPWLGSNYSTRIWNNNEQFIERVQQTIEDGITGGHSISRMADRLESFVKVPKQGQRYIVERLARSETAHFMAEGQLHSYKEIGIEKYQFVAALSELTCDTCGGLDGEVIDVSRAVAGENYPPIHANCRCTTVMAGFNPATRIARDPLTGKNYKVDGSMTFEEWKDSLSDEQKAALKYVDKSGGSGIIRENKTKKPVTVITDKAIDSVPFVYIPGYSEDQCYYIQAQHKELLEYARDCNKNKEVAFVLEDYDLYTKSKFKGEDDKIDFGHSLSGEDMVIIHNHPRNKSYSMNDINFFKNFNGVKTLTIVKNNGSVEYLTKSVNYDAQIFRLEFNRLYKKMVKDGTDAELDRFVERLLNKTKSGVIWSEKK